ncbi:MAG: SCO family protein [Pseudomonadota bacterium]
MKICLTLLLGILFGLSRATAAPLPLGGDFTLETPRGVPVSLSSLRGKVVLLYFGFTYCPEMCPTELLQFQQLLERLPADKRGRVQPVFISVDPARDTPEVLEPYIGHFGGGILALTGKEEELRRVAAQYGAHFRYVPTGSSYTVDHTVNTYVVDPQGHLVRVFMYGSPTKELAGYILSLLPD